jgi:excisionase family DNA binding protein
MTKPNPRPDRPMTMTVPEVAAYLRIHPSTVYRMLRNKQLPGFRLGDWRFNVEQIDQWRRARERIKAGQGKPVTPLHRARAAPHRKARRPGLGAVEH